ncbi:MAG: transcription termination factor Rho [Sedimentisphaerales bacterium]|nr:transcription termination factor Rho [Sedimentisphaerales bacterium]
MGADKNTETEVKGLLEVVDKGHGFLRQVTMSYLVKPNDPYVGQDVIDKYGLRPGLMVEGVAKGKRGPGPNVTKIARVNDQDIDDYLDVEDFDEFLVVDPQEHLRLETGAEPLGPRVIDLLTPIGKGQRGLIVAPPRTGKTVLLQQIAHGIATNNPEVHLMVLLIDERPEEVTDMRRNIEGEVIASSNDKGVDSHVRTARLALERVKRLMEFGQDVVVLMDSITRLGRAFNSWIKSSGRTMSGGVDIRALQLPKQLFGSARKAENGGSLTIIATALIDTGSRMDEVIFQEFKGTGNMELVLDRQLANRRIWPAIDIQQSGTRKEELLIGKDALEKIFRLRRHLSGMPPGQDVEMLLKALKKHPSNAEFLAELP